MAALLPDEVAMVICAPGIKAPEGSATWPWMEAVGNGAAAALDERRYGLRCKGRCVEQVVSSTHSAWREKRFQ